MLPWAKHDMLSIWTRLRVFCIPLMFLEYEATVELASRPVLGHLGR